MAADLDVDIVAAVAGDRFDARLVEDRFVHASSAHRELDHRLGLIVGAHLDRSRRVLDVQAYLARRRESFLAHDLAPFIF